MLITSCWWHAAKRASRLHCARETLRCPFGLALTNTEPPSTFRISQPIEKLKGCRRRFRVNKKAPQRRANPATETGGLRCGRGCMVFALFTHGGKPAPPGNQARIGKLYLGRNAALLPCLDGGAAHIQPLRQGRNSTQGINDFFRFSFHSLLLSTKNECLQAVFELIENNACILCFYLDNTKHQQRPKWITPKGE